MHLRMDSEGCPQCLRSGRKVNKILRQSFSVSQKINKQKTNPECSRQFARDTPNRKQGPESDLFNYTRRSSNSEEPGGALVKVTLEAGVTSVPSLCASRYIEASRVW